MPTSESVSEWVMNAADPDKNKCPCHGSGWMLSDYDTFHQCRIHYKGQKHPEEYDDYQPNFFESTWWRLMKIYSWFRNKLSKKEVPF